ncbi:hypothetical protein FHW36_110164 [Chitinophaga polysaccharea]|uniref:Uncharacterized protein n=1 Tax=Chitinophaga polysaccharea TaxID=1293035 RepID=A0A561P9Z2_9BACT|nr:hypothetical protein FHW36_110164 [Chitinophaga polysaccharea]
MTTCACTCISLFAMSGMNAMAQVSTNNMDTPIRISFISYFLFITVDESIGS